MNQRHGQSGQERDGYISGRNNVLEAFRSGRSVERVYLQKGLKSGPIESIIKLAKRSGCIYSFEEKSRLRQLCGDDNHQGVVAVVSDFTYASVEDILQAAADAGEDPFIVIADGIEDPHNLGAIIRSAHEAGAHGLIIPKRRAVHVTATAASASAGAVHYLPVAKVTNLTQTIEQLKNRGIWFAAADMEGSSMYETALDGPIGIVVGSEGSGVSRLVREACDMVVSIPMKGRIGSLNASVAAGILCFEVLHQRAQKSKPGEV